MKALMNQLRESAVKAILNADSPENLEALRVKYLRKLFSINSITRLCQTLFKFFLTFI